MSLNRSLLLTLSLTILTTASNADPVAPFGIASAYNLVALGYSNGSVSIQGTISTQADVTGRAAAADAVTTGTTFGSSLNSDPWGSLATYGLVSTQGLGAGQSYNLNGGGNAYAPGSNGNINFNDGGHRITAGGSGIDFATLATTLDGESVALNGLQANGVVLGTNQAGYGNPSWLILKGSSPTLNVFNITAAEFADTNHNIDIDAPVGSTIVVNVDGTNVMLGAGLYYNGHQTSGDSGNDANILFNFAGAQTVAIDAQFNASVLAPFAVLSGTGQMGGNFIAAQIGPTGEVHNVEFDGTLPGAEPGDPKSLAAAPEPGTWLMVGTGLMSFGSAMRKRIRE